jgi:hypothetical protein
MYVSYSSRMTIEQTRNTTVPGVAYAALRHGGASPREARLELGLSSPAAARLERRVQKGARGGDAMRPAFARHEDHTASVVAAGGYPVLGVPTP